MTPGIVFFETAMMTLVGLLCGYLLQSLKTDEQKRIVKAIRRTNANLTAALIASERKTCERVHVGDINDIEAKIQRKLGFKVKTPNDIDSVVADYKDQLGI